MLPVLRAAAAPSRGTLLGYATHLGRPAVVAKSSRGPTRSLKVLCALYPDPHTGFPPPSVRDSLPRVTHYANGATTPSPKAIDFVSGALLGSVSGGLGLSRFLAARGAEYIVTSDKDGAGCELERHLHDADVVISQVRACRCAHASITSV